jgi:hypothetical protein
MAILRTNVLTIIAHKDELEHPDFALESYTDPKVHTTHVVVISLAETELARVEPRASADSQP